MISHAAAAILGGLAVYLARWGVSRVMTMEERDAVYRAGFNQAWQLRRRREQEIAKRLLSHHHRPAVLPDDGMHETEVH